jgi:hypothetical protein
MQQAEHKKSNMQGRKAWKIKEQTGNEKEMAE